MDSRLSQGRSERLVELIGLIIDIVIPNTTHPRFFPEIHPTIINYTVFIIEPPSLNQPTPSLKYLTPNNYIESLRVL